MAAAISLVSLALVVGGLSLALSENVTPPPMATETLWLPTYAEFITITSTAQILPTDTSFPTASNTPVPPVNCTPPSGWIGVIVAPGENLAAIALRYNTSSEALIQANCLLTPSLVPGSVLYVPPASAAPTAIQPPAATATYIPCGAPYGWVRYAVQAGDTLYHIASSYGITTAQLQRANCLGASTLIHIGQLLWVPNVPTRTPGVTAIPTYYFPTEQSTETALPFTETIEPTSTSTVISTSTSIPTPVTPSP
jgi:LysM repeat protein